MRDITDRQEARKEAERLKYEQSYSAHLAQMRARLDGEDGVAVIGHASYIIRLGGVRIAVDPCSWLTPKAEGAYEALLSLVSSCDAVIYTHAHRDHFTACFADALPKTMTLFIPDFMEYVGENVVHTADGMTVRVGSLLVHFFGSDHDHGKSEVPQYGFALAHEGRHYVFPADVRGYATPHRVFPKTAMLLAHLWLGRGVANDLDACETEGFCRFVSEHHAERVLVGHLCDYRRDTPFFWAEAQYELVKDRLGDSRTVIFGDFVAL